MECGGQLSRGSQPYGALDMAGNVWEWTSSGLEADYPYNPKDGREDPDADSAARVRGGSFIQQCYVVRCAVRNVGGPADRDVDIGFRVVVSPGF